jgi:signal transduction histidine kinase
VALAVFTVSVGFAISVQAGVLVILTSLGLGGLVFIHTRARYRELASIAEQIDQVLHDIDSMVISGFEEGELSILQSEVTKMTLRIREQNAALREDRQFLADSLADIAHQLRNPLMSATLILSSLAELDAQVDADVEAQATTRQQSMTQPTTRQPATTQTTTRQQAINEVRELLFHMDWLITTLLKLSRMDAGVIEFEHQEVRVSELVESAIRPVAISAELRNIELSIAVEDETLIHGDLRWLSEALLNILKNSIEAQAEHGSIEIMCRQTPLFVELSIHDSGPGFTSRDLAHLFDRFYQGANSSKSGFGIGLALSKAIITRHNGTLSASNHPQGGAVFSIRFKNAASGSPL